jgi:hypothetical protein
MKRTLGPWFWTVVILDFPPTLVLAGMVLIGHIRHILWDMKVATGLRSQQHPDPVFAYSDTLFVAASLVLTLPFLVACLAMIRPTVSILAKVSIALVIVTSGLLVRWLYRVAGVGADLWFLTPLEWWG